MRLYVDLTQGEEDDIHGWVNYFTEHPAELPFRLVLKERSHARLEQIAAQFNPAPPPLPFDVETPTMDYLRHEYTLQVGRILAIAVQIPLGPYPLGQPLGVSVVEFESPSRSPIYRAALNEAAGVIPAADGELVSQGKEVSAHTDVSAFGRFKPGATAYYNVMIESLGQAGGASSHIGYTATPPH